MKIEKIENKYNIELDFKELDIIYHALGLYTDGLNNIISMQWGIHLTKGEITYWNKAEEITKIMKENEPLLYHCIDFEYEG